MARQTVNMTQDSCRLRHLNIPEYLTTLKSNPLLNSNNSRYVAGNREIKSPFLARPPTKIDFTIRNNELRAPLRNMGISPRMKNLES